MGIQVYNKINLVKEKKKLRLQMLTLFKEVILFFALLAYPVSDSLAQLTVNNVLTPNQLVQNVILGPGVQATNVSYTGANDAAGTYACFSCGLGSSTGLILSTGNVFLATGPNSSSGMGKNQGLPGDPDLSTMIAPYVTLDAAALEFDFTVESDSVEIRYVFASEEYNELVNFIFNDVFAFFISGPGYNGVQNIALVPGSGNNAGITTINNGLAAPGQTAAGPCANCQYYRDNANPLTASVNIEYDGLTTILTARARVYPCERYHIKLAIADANHQNFDSGIFIEAGSFKAGDPIRISLDTSQISGWVRQDTVFLCMGDTAVFCAPEASSYNWSSGDTTQCIKVTQAGTYYIDMSQGSCVAVSNSYTVLVDTTTIKCYPNGPVTIPFNGSVTLCVTGGVQCIWSTGDTAWCITVTVSGTYTATVTTAFGCKIVKSFGASSGGGGTGGGGSANVYVTCSSQLCAGQSAVLTVHVLNFPAHNVLWSTGATSNSITVSTGGTYVVTVTSFFGFSISSNFHVTIISPSVSISGGGTVCPGGVAYLSAGNNPNYTYQWSTGANTSSVFVGPGLYYVTITDNYGCTASASSNVNMANIPNPVISGNNVLCTSSGTTLNAGPGYFSYYWSTGQFGQTINVTTSGVYTVTVTNGAGCSGSDDIQVTVQPLPTVNLSGPSNLCSGATAQLSAGAGFTSYQWSTGAISQSISVNSPSLYVVTVTNLAGCSNTDSILVNLLPSPNPFITGPNKVCFGTTSNLVADSNYVQYLWSNGASTTGINSGVGTYIVTVSDLNGCTGTAIQQVSAHPIPQVAITGISDVCHGDSTVLSAANGFLSYIWNTGDTINQITVDSSGNYSVIVTDIHGCTGNDNYSFNINKVPDPNVNGPANICDGDTATLIASSGWSSYNWSNGSTSSSTTASQTSTFLVTVSDAIGCMGTDTFTLIVNSNPTIGIRGLDTLCPGVSTILSADPGYAGYSWSTGAFDSTVSVSSGIYTVVVTDSNGCTSEDNKEVHAYILPPLTIVGAGKICNGDSAVLNASAGFASYSWNQGANTQSIMADSAGLYIVTVIDSNGCVNADSAILLIASLPAPVILGASSICKGDSALIYTSSSYNSYSWSNGSTDPYLYIKDTANYIVTVVDSVGCKGTSSFSLIVHENPQPIINGPDFICKGDQATLDAGIGFVNYNWSNGGGTSTITVADSALYYVNVVDSNGCKGTSPIHSLWVDIPIARIKSHGSLIFCDNDSVKLSANEGTNYVWSDGSSTSFISVGGTGYYHVLVTDSLGCIAKSDSIYTETMPVPQVGIDQSRLRTCEILAMSFANEVMLQGVIYHWNFGDGSTSSQFNPLHLYSSHGIYYIGLEITNQYGCSDKDSVRVDLEPAPKPRAYFEILGEIPPLFEGSVNFTDFSLNAERWLWSFGDGILSDEQHPKHFYSDLGKHVVTLRIENSVGCVSEFSRELVIKPFHIPNAFTPNGDGRNDTFIEAGYQYGNVSTYSMKIFDRWGKMVYRSQNAHVPWDGKVNNNPAQEGAYIYVMDIATMNGQAHQYTGNVNLIR